MDLNDYREQIDQIDDQMLDLFLKRMDVSTSIAEYKKAHDLPILNRQREREILRDVSEKCGPMDLYGRRFVSNLMELSKAYQAEQLNKPTKLIETIENSRLPASAVFPRDGIVALQGVEGSYSQEAAERLFPRGDLRFKTTFADVFDAVENGEVQYGIVPIENSSYGSVRDVYALLQERDVHITRAVRINVRHELLAAPGTKLRSIKEIISHDQAIGQCDKYLKSLGPDVKITKAVNTAMAAKLVAEADRTDLAAIASHEAGQVYGLKSLKSDIMDSENNYTRFIVIRKEPAVYPGAQRISLILSTEHRAGALYDVIAAVSANDINMVKLESVPIVGTDFEFGFFIDLEASVWEPNVLGLLAYLERTTDFFKYLGNYPEF